MADVKIYVGGLPNDASSQELEDVFQKYGRVRKVWVARRPPGFAFVEMEDRRDAEDAVRALDGEQICGNRARVELSNNNRNRRDGGGGGRGGYGGGDRSRDRRSRSRSGGRGRSRSPRRRTRSPPRRASRSKSRSRSPPRRDSRSKSRSRSRSPSFR